MSSITSNSHPNEMIWIPSKNNQYDIPCLYFRNDKSNLLIIFSHDTHDNLASHHHTLSKLADSIGINILAWEYPSQSIPNDESIIENVWKFATETIKYNQYNIIFFGHSIGTDVTCHFVSQINNNLSFNPAGIILLNPFDSIDTNKEKNLNGTQWNNSEALKKIKSPLLILHDRTNVTMSEQCKKLYVASNSHSKTMISFNLDTDTIADTIKIFIKNNINKYLLSDDQPIMLDQSFSKPTPKNGFFGGLFSSIKSLLF